MDYPYLKCFKPLKIRKNNKQLLVPCGKCVACQNRLHTMRSLMCQMLENSYKYTMFVTLTYSDEFLPMFKVEYDKEKDKIMYVNLSPRLDCYYNYDYVDNVFDVDSLDEVYERTHWNGFLSYAPKKDLQNFIKRFRKYLIELTNEKVLYYGVSEYGCKYLRAHFHVLFFFNSEIIFKHFRQILRASWSYGIADYSLSRGKTSGYVAQYLNSTLDIPEVLQNSFAKPFQIHSQSFVPSDYQEIAKSIYSSDYSATFFPAFTLGKRLFLLPILHTLEVKLFPKCVGFDTTDIAGLYRMYSYYRTKAIYYKNVNGSIANLVLACWLDNKNSPLLTYEQIEARLRFSYNFDKLCSLVGRSYSYVINLIIQYYKLKELENEKRISLACENGADWRLFDSAYFSHEQLKKDSLYKGFFVDEQLKAENNVKHKKQNELNKIL